MNRKVFSCFLCSNHLAEEGELVIGKKSVGLVHEEVSPDKLLETPVFALNKPAQD